jgi:DNA-binding Xre family transcriptional regulator
MGDDSGKPLSMAKKMLPKRVMPRFKKPLGLPLLSKWRKYRDGMTQEELAERAGVTHGLISQLENGKVRYGQETLEALAEALNCKPAHILNVDPTKDDAIWDIWETASEAEKAQIVAVGRAVVKRAS